MPFTRRIIEGAILALLASGPALADEARYFSSGIEWTDPALSGGRIKAAHLEELRRHADECRGHWGLAPFPWTDANVRASPVPVKARHLLELRRAIEEAYEKAGKSALVWAGDVEVGHLIRRAHWRELRDSVAACPAKPPTQEEPSGQSCAELCGDDTPRKAGSCMSACGGAFPSDEGPCMERFKGAVVEVKTKRCCCGARQVVCTVTGKSEKGVAALLMGFTGTISNREQSPGACGVSSVCEQIADAGTARFDDSSCRAGRATWVAPGKSGEFEVGLGLGAGRTFPDKHPRAFSGGFQVDCPLGSFYSTVPGRDGCSFDGVNPGSFTCDCVRPQ